jgi:predicted NUDIX family NTP pyrophosphohydrolase
VREFPEVDRVEWFPLIQARTKLLKGQRSFLDMLMAQPELTGLIEEC